MITREWLGNLSHSTQSSEEDSSIMQGILHKMGFSTAVVTCGIVYLDGHGTLEAPPTSIHSIAKMLLTAAENTEKGGK